MSQLQRTARRRVGLTEANYNRTEACGAVAGLAEPGAPEPPPARGRSLPDPSDKRANPGLIRSPDWANRTLVFLMPPAPTVNITGIAAASALGDTWADHLRAMAAGRCGLRPLADHPGPGLEPFAHLHAGWLQDRDAWFRGRRYGAASNAAVRAASQACLAAGWSASDRAEAWLFGGSSRANVGELLHVWPSRRPIAKFRASNSMHSEVTAAVSIELGLRGPWQMLANGCSAGLDAIGLAWVALRAGVAKRALVVSVELPLCHPLLQGFSDTGLLAAADARNDPFHPECSGFFPAEAVTAMALEVGGDPSAPEVLWYGANSDAYDSIALEPNGQQLSQLIHQAQQAATAAERSLTTLCPHGNGTQDNRTAETAAMRSALPQGPYALHLLKPFVGHPLGASGSLETALLAAALRQGNLPHNLPGLTPPGPDLTLPTEPPPIHPDQAVLKWAIGMGGHNAGLLIGPGKDA